MLLVRTFAFCSCRCCSKSNFILNAIYRLSFRSPVVFWQCFLHSICFSHASSYANWKYLIVLIAWDRLPKSVVTIGTGSSAYEKSTETCEIYQGLVEVIICEISKLLQFLFRTKLNNLFTLEPNHSTSQYYWPQAEVSAFSVLSSEDGFFQCTLQSHATFAVHLLALWPDDPPNWGLFPCLNTVLSLWVVNLITNPHLMLVW